MIETTPDVVPVIDEADGLPGFHSQPDSAVTGSALALGAGKAIAGFLTGNDVGLDVREFRLRRFSDGTPIRSKASGCLDVSRLRSSGFDQRKGLG